MSEDASGGSNPGSVSRAIGLLTLLADQGEEMGVNQIAEALSLPPSTTHRLLRLLRGEGLVRFNAGSRRYGVGHGFYRMAARVIEAVPVTDLARDFVDELAASFNETALLGLYLDHDRALSFAVRSDGDQLLQYRIEMHRPLSLLWGASGRSILAHLPATEIRQVLDLEGPAPASGQVPPTAAELEVALNEVREKGYAVSAGEKLPGARGIAAPVFGPGGVVGCIMITSPADRLTAAKESLVIEGVTRSARQLSDVLGPRPGTTA